MARDCKHGGLARVCPLCECERERDEYKRQRDEARELWKKYCVEAARRYPLRLRDGSCPAMNLEAVGPTLDMIVLGECELLRAKLERAELERDDADAERNVSNASLALIEEKLIEHGARWEHEFTHEVFVRVWGEMVERVKQLETTLDSLKEMRHGCWRDIEEVLGAIDSVRRAALEGGDE